MSFFSFINWSGWWSQITSMLLSFKFIAFFTVVFLIIGLWVSLMYLYSLTIDSASVLLLKGIITKEGATSIITNAQKVLFDDAVSHIGLSVTAILTSIIALNGVQYFTNSSENKELLKQAKTSDSSIEELKKFLPKNFGQNKD
jgi:hypothetical protein